MKLRKQGGITLIALVVTIVVLLILAGVSINVLFGDSGLIKSANNAKEKMEKAKADEQQNIEDTVNLIDKISGGETIKVVEPENPDNWTYNVDEDGAITILGYKEAISELVVPNYINGVAVKRVGNGKIRGRILKGDGETVHLGGSSDWFAGNASTKKIVISDGIEQISDYAFAGSRALEEIKLSSTLKSIGETAFYEANSLRSITIPSSVTSTGYGIFSGSTNITVNVPFKENEKPDGWDTDWSATWDSCTLNINYAK